MISPVFGVTAPAFTPDQPLPCSRYSLHSDIFHIHFSVTMKTNLPSCETISASTISSPADIRMARTPAAALHITRTSVS